MRHNNAMKITKRSMRGSALLGFALAAIAPMCLQAQNIFGDTNFGEISLESGFSPDPYVKSVNAGGSTEFDSCTGYFSADPDFNLNYEAGDFKLGIFAKSGADTTIAINDPDGDWLCNDDSDFLTSSNPGLLIENPLSGLYNIWVGVYSEDDAYESAELVITELDEESWDSLELEGSTSSTGTMNIFGEPNYGLVNLENGFVPDPNITELLIGGSVESGQSGCTGFFAADPDLNLDYAAASGTQLGIFASSDVDTTLAINTPGGKWVCDDDSQFSLGINPGVLFESPESGVYNIWVGSYSSTDSLESHANLHITELDSDGWGDMIDGVGTATDDLDVGAEPNFGTYDLESGFLPDPHVTEVLAGGSLESSHCAGFYSSAPDVDLNYVAGASDLGFIARATSDTTIVVNDPDGNWHCSDDSEFLDNSNAGILIENPSSGLYDIWIGTFSSDDALETDAQLLITEFDPEDWRSLGGDTGQFFADAADTDEEELGQDSDQAGATDVTADVTQTDLTSTTAAVVISTSTVQFGRKSRRDQ